MFSVFQLKSLENMWSPLLLYKKLSNSHYTSFSY